MAVMLPDESECNIMLEDLKVGEKPYPGVLLTSLRRGEEGDTRIFKVSFHSIFFHGVIKFRRNNSNYS